MKKPRTFLLFLYAFLSNGFLAHARAQAPSPPYAQADTSAHAVSAAEYCKFLNDVALSDPDHLYDQKIETDPEAACIVRLGTPEKYQYQAIAGRENIPVFFVSEQAALECFG